MSVAPLADLVNEHDSGYAWEEIQVMLAVKKITPRKYHVTMDHVLTGHSGEHMANAQMNVMVVSRYARFKLVVL